MVESEQHERASMEVYLHQERKQRRLVYGAYEMLKDLINEAVFQLKRVADPQTDSSTIAAADFGPSMHTASDDGSSFLLEKNSLSVRGH